MLAGLGAASMFFGCKDSQSALFPLSAGEIGKVSLVRDGDSISLDTGLSVRLAGIEAPRLSWKDRAAEPFGEEAAKQLMLAALGRKCQLFYGGLTRDKYKRAIAHVFVEDEAGQKIWLNGYMLENGGARVRTWADNAARVRQMYEIETLARQTKQGLWAHEKYKILSPEQLEAAPRGLVVLEGKISHLSEVVEPESRCKVANDGALAISMGLSLARSSERMELALGQTIRLRSGVRRERDKDGEYSGKAFLTLDHWGQFETDI